MAADCVAHAQYRMRDRRTASHTADRSILPRGAIKDDKLTTGEFRIYPRGQRLSQNDALCTFSFSKVPAPAGGRVQARVGACGSGP